MAHGQRLETDDGADKPSYYHNGSRKRRNAAQRLSHLHSDGRGDRLACERHDDSIGCSQHLRNDHYTHDTRNTSHRLRSQDGEKLALDGRELQIKRNTEGHHCGLQPELYQFRSLVVSLIGNIHCEQKYDDDGDGYQNRVEKYPPKATL